MSLAAGIKVGPYEIVSPLGAGGMGEVYRATDMRLGRDVALKILPETFARDADRMARFEREAKVLASLNHPNIAHIYGVEESNSTRALVMELVEGPTLAARIKQGPLPVDEALPIAKQIADGLEYAHERGIIHRDLKPSNVKLTYDEQVKILDFGLAKALENESSETELPNSPTLSVAATRTGVLLGTAAYMSPEQARGKRVDRRADIWAFGCVFYEILTGTAAFAGETTSDVLASVIRAEPNWSLLPANTPQRLENLLRRSLKKDPRQRVQAIGEARIVFEEVLSGAGPDETVTAPARAQNKPSWQSLVPWALVIILAVAVLGWAYMRLANAPLQAMVSEIPPPEGQNFVLGGGSTGAPVLSPDGQQLAFVAAGSDGREVLWVRRLNETSARMLASTEGARYPFWSPDGRSLGFFASSKLNRIDVSGGPPLAISDVQSESRGGSWGPDDTILFTPTVSSVIYRVPASGGTPTAVTKLNEPQKEVSHRWPQFLPDGKHFLYFAMSTDAAEFGGTHVASLDGREMKFIRHSASNSIYAPPGYLLSVFQGTLIAQQFDPKSFRLSGQSVPLAEHVAENPTVHRGLFAVSGNGVLVYEAGSTMGGRYRLVWLDRKGKEVGETGTPAGYINPRLSPDGRKLAVSIISPSAASGAIWVFDLASGTSTRLTFSSAVINGPAWSPDARTIAFVSNETHDFHLYQKAADGTGNVMPLLIDDAAESQPCFSPDGRYLVFARRATQGVSRPEIWAIPLFGDHKAFPLVQTSSGPGAAAPVLSPNGKWLAYMSAESGRDEVFVVPFGHGSGKWLVSPNGGELPRWRGDGKELFYMTADNKMMSAEITEQGSSLSIGKVQELFKPSFPVFVAPGNALFDVSPDGKKFVMVDRGVQEASAPLTLVVNWPGLLKNAP